ncbi:MAG: hypothetical protein RIE77_06885 [Phycisphaerales bacterium]
MRRNLNIVAAIVVASGLAASAASAQIADVVWTTDDDDDFGAWNTDAGISVGSSAVVCTQNMHISILNKSGVVQEDHGVTDATFPFIRVDDFVGTGSGDFPSRFFDPQTVYDPEEGRLWIVYSENNTSGSGESFGTGDNDISALHLAVNKDPAFFPVGGTLDTFDDDYWWYYTGKSVATTGIGNGGAYFDLQNDDIAEYPDGGPHTTFPDGPNSLVDKPHMAVDEQAVYIATTGGSIDSTENINGTLLIIPTSHGSGLSIYDGDKPDYDDLTFIRMNELPAVDGHNRHYAVQEPYDQVSNAQFFVSGPGGDDQDTIRLGGLWYDDDPIAPRWHYSQRVATDTSTTPDDMDLNPGLEFSTDGSYRAVTPDTAAGDWEIRTGGTFFPSAVLVKDGNSDECIFAVHHVRPMDDSQNPAVPEDRWVVQWYVIDPDLAKFRSISGTTGTTPSSSWDPQIVAMGRLDDDDGDRIHPVIGVTKQGVAYIEFTYTSSTVWPEVRRVQLNNAYTDIVPNSEVTVQGGVANEYFTTDPEHRIGWADFADMQADPSNDCVFWSTHTLVHEDDLTVNDKRDIWFFETVINCNNANLNGDGGVDLLDMAMFNDYYSTGARRVDMNTDGTTDSTDAIIYNDAYDEQKD